MFLHEPLLRLFAEIRSGIVLLNERSLPSENNQLVEFELSYFYIIYKMKTIITNFRWE